MMSLDPDVALAVASVQSEKQPATASTGASPSDALVKSVASDAKAPETGTGAGSATTTGPVPAKAQEVFRQMRRQPAQWLTNERDLGTLSRDLSSGNATVVGIERLNDVREVFVQTREGTSYFVTATAADKVESWLGEWAKKGGTYAYIKPESGDFLLLRFLLLAAVFVAGYLGFRRYILPSADASSSVIQAGAVSKNAPSRARGFTVIREHDIRFADVIGAHEAKDELIDLLECLKSPEHFRRLKAKAPRGILLSGPPGTGKSLLAKALAGEANSAFIACTGSDFSDKYYGESVKNVRALFELARKNAPCIIFIDEVDGLAARSTGELSGGDMEQNRTINAILAEMDGFVSAEGVIVLAATNYPELLDKAMLREGRFDRKVTVKLPTVADREELFRYYAKKTVVREDVDLGALARRSTGMSPAAIASTVNRAATLAAKAHAVAVDDEHLRTAMEHQLIGAPDKHYVSDEAERRRVAYHEAGHAVIARLLGLGTVEKATIVPHGNARGLTLVTNEREDNMQTRTRLFSHMVMLLGGRAAELLEFNEHGSGVSDDLGRASAIAYDMVSKLGFGQDVGAFSIAYLPKDVVADVNAKMIGESVRLVKSAADESLRLLEENRTLLTRLAEKLLEQEVVELEEMDTLLAA
jgi:cell division protease FtsH